MASPRRSFVCINLVVDCESDGELFQIHDELLDFSGKAEGRLVGIVHWRAFIEADVLWFVQRILHS